MPAKKPQKKITPKRSIPAKKRSPSKSRTVSYEEMKSFLVYKSPESFFTTRVTRQTAYWIILLLVIVATQAWILAIQYDLMRALDSLQ